MPVSPDLHRKLRETLGADAADDLVTQMEAIDAIRGDISEMRQGLTRLEGMLTSGLARLDGSITSTRAEMAALRAEMAALMEKGLREQTRFFFLAWSVLLAAIVGLYAR